MGKKGNWFTSAVKKAFLPSKEPDKVDAQNQAKHCLPTTQQKNKSSNEKKRWSVGRMSHQEASLKGGNSLRLPEKPFSHVEEEQNKNALAVAVATAAAAEAAVAAAQAAVEVVKLTGVARTSIYGGWSRENWAAIKIQAAFRGYLARRALRALKALVRLQALVRGHTVRRQATVTLKCMQSLARVQAKVRARRVCSLEENRGAQRELWQKQQCDVTSRKSVSDISHQDGWNDSSHSAEEIQAKIQSKQEAALKRERALAYASSHQIWKSAPNSDCVLTPSQQEKFHWGWNWLERWWMSGRPCDDHVVDKNILEDSLVGNFEETPVFTGHLKARAGSLPQPPMLSHACPAISTAASKSVKQPLYIQPPAASDELKLAAYNVQSVSPKQSQTFDENGSTISVVGSIPSLVSAPPKLSSRQSIGSSSVCDDESLASFPSVPSYMTSTQSARAKLRSHSTPKQRRGIPEKESISSGNKRLSYPPMELFVGASGALKTTRTPAPQRSPSLKVYSGPLKFNRYLNGL